MSSPAYTDPTRGNENYPDQSTTSFNIVPNAYLAELSNTNYDPNLNFMLQNQDFNISTSSFDNKLVNVNEPSISKVSLQHLPQSYVTAVVANNVASKIINDPSMEFSGSGPKYKMGSATSSSAPSAHKSTNLRYDNETFY